MNDHLGRQLASKWLKTKAMLAHRYTADHVPPSKLYSRSRLRTMIHRYGTVVIKPVRGAGGRGVMKISRSENEYAYTHKFHTGRTASFHTLCHAVDAVRGGRAYLIQRGIDLARVRGRPVDYRVKYVKTRGRWMIRSMVGRMARRGLFVTNLCRGGALLTAAEALSQSLSPVVVTAKKREMRHLTKTATRLLESRYPGIRQLGYDYGIDRNGHIWILEVNTRPQ